jgi:hypothetical protein
MASMMTSNIGFSWRQMTNKMVVARDFLDVRKQKVIRTMLTATT